MKGAIYKKPYVPPINFVIRDTDAGVDKDQLRNDLQVYLWILRGRYSFANQNLPLRDIVLTQPLYRRKNEEKFMESLHNISRNLAIHLLDIFSDISDAENDVVKSAEKVVHKGVDASMEDHMVVINIAEQLRQIPKFA